MVSSLRPPAEDAGDLLVSLTALVPEVDQTPPARRVRPGRRRWTLATFVALGVLLVVVVTVGHVRGGAGSGLQTVAAVPYWNLDAGTHSVLAHRGALTMVSPWLYGMGDNGQVVPLRGAQTKAASADLTRLRASGLKVVPTVTNVRDGEWLYGPVARLLHDPTLMRRHIQSVVGLVRDTHLDGIDIDYEELRSADRAAFTAFLAALADALHADHKLLSVDVFAKTTNAGYDQRNLAQDYAAIGRVADQVRLMAYDYHWTTSAPGPIAPIDWVRDVLLYARTQIPARKIVLGVGLYGYDWSDGRGSPLTWVQVYGRAKEHGSTVRWDLPSQSPWLTYTDQAGRPHQIWFENAYSASAKFVLARQYGINGVYLWMFGSEDDLTWNKLRENWAGRRNPAGAAGTRP